MASPDFAFAAQAFVTLFLIVDPVGVIPVFAGLIGRYRERERMRMIRRAVLIACAVLLVFTVFGNLIFSYLGITMYAFRIAGGVLLLIISIEMLFGGKTRTEVSEDMGSQERDDLTVSPMAVPLLTGPGAITSGIMLFQSAPSGADRAFLCAVVVLVFAVSYGIVANYGVVYRRLGNTGTKVVTRLMGLLLSAIAVQFIIAGVREAFPAFA